jgi:hypothetical protein
MAKKKTDVAATAESTATEGQEAQAAVVEEQAGAVEEQGATVEAEAPAVEGVVVASQQVGDEHEILDEIRVVRHRMEEGYFQLAALLHKVWNGLLYQKWGFKTFDQFVEDELGFKKRKAQYLISIHQYVEKTITDDKVRAQLVEVGWTKVKELVGVIDDSNAEKWIENARKMNVLEVVEAAKEALRIKAGANDAPTDTDDSGSGPKKPTGTVKRMSLGLYPEQKQNLDAALQLAGEIAHSDKQGHLLDLMATSFLATNVDRSTETLFKHVERSMGVRLIAIDNETSKIVYGDETVDFMLKVLQAAEDATALPAEGVAVPEPTTPEPSDEVDEDEDADGEPVDANQDGENPL